MNWLHVKELCILPTDMGLNPQTLTMVCSLSLYCHKDGFMTDITYIRLAQVIISVDLSYYAKYSNRICSTQFI